MQIQHMACTGLLLGSSIHSARAKVLQFAQLHMHEGSCLQLGSICLFWQLRAVDGTKMIELV